MGAAVGALTMNGFYPNTIESDYKIIDYKPSDCKNHTLESTEDALKNIKKYFIKFDFDTETIKDKPEEINQLKLIETPIARFLSEKGGIFRSKLPEFNGNHLFYKINTNGDIARNEKGESICKTVSESCEYLGALVKKEILIRRTNGDYNIDDLKNLVEHNFITHYIHLLETSVKGYKDSIFEYYKNIISHNTQNTKNKYGIKSSPLFPEEQIHYLREIIASIIDYTRKTVQKFGENLRSEIFGEQHFPVNCAEIEPRLIKKPYIEVVRTKSVTQKIKSFVNNIFKRN